MAMIGMVMTAPGYWQQCTEQDAGGVDKHDDDDEEEDNDDDDEGDGDEDQDDDDFCWGLPVAVHRPGCWWC